MLNVQPPGKEKEWPKNRWPNSCSREDIKACKMTEDMPEKHQIVWQIKTYDGPSI